MIIRKKEFKDVEPWIEINISSWNDNFKNIVSKRILSIINANKEDRILKEKENFKEDDEHYVLEDENGVVGILQIKKSDREGLEDCGEVQLLYLFTKAKNKGYGRVLLSTAYSQEKRFQ